ncbi:MAG TPA: MarR family transcriptional regulator [Deltaproteobacteria bacterium]|nr:MarR family transcriptional regulator [Deltaproteobacteria bacterium]
MAGLEHELDAPPWKRVESTLMAMARAIRQAYEDRFARLDLNLAQASMLAFLFESGPRSQSRLAAQLGMGRASAGLVVSALEKRGLVERRPDPADGRTRLVALRPAGEALVRPILEIDEILRSELRTGISRAERQRLAALLLRLQDNLSGVLADRPD